MAAYTTGLPLLALLAWWLVLPAQAQDADKNFYIGGSIGYSNLAVDDPATDYPPIYSFYYPDIPAIRTDSYDVDEKDKVWGIYGGYLFNQYFGIEAAYIDIGEAKINQNSTYIFTEAQPGRTSTNTQGYVAAFKSGLNGFQLTGLARYPFTDRFSLYARLGGVRMKNVLEKDTTITWSILTTRTGFPDTNQVIPPSSGSSTESNHSIDMTFGLGAEYDLTENIAIRGQWQQYRIRTEWEQYGIKMKNNIDTYTVGVSYRFGL